MAAFVGALGAILAVQVAYRLGVAGWIGTVFVAIVAAGGSAAAWLRLSGFRIFTLVLSPAALVVTAGPATTAEIAAIAAAGGARGAAG